MMSVTKADIENFQHDGAILLQGVFSKEWIEKIKDGIKVKKQTILITSDANFCYLDKLR